MTHFVRDRRQRCMRVRADGLPCGVIDCPLDHDKIGHGTLPSPKGDWDFLGSELGKLLDEHCKDDEKRMLFQNYLGELAPDGIPKASKPPVIIPPPVVEQNVVINMKRTTMQKVNEAMSTTGWGLVITYVLYRLAIGR